ncbi:hypothetical protein L596_024208 [Steinernema carpocapsae]|uniref:Uncharacterized protein n=1 Tax=Steinernema carpocapsae TaxID=34508 RepID=A0A4U5MGS5_STECR|nr:hypothetical protein L596_024208 [Steinernema carpocapsae]
MSGIKRQSKTFPVCKATFAGKSRPDSPATTSRDFILGQHHCRQSVARIQSVNSFRIDRPNFRMLQVLIVSYFVYEIARLYKLEANKNAPVVVAGVPPAAAPTPATSTVSI